MLNANPAKSHSSRIFISIVNWFWKFAQSTAVILPCSVQNFKMVWQLSNMLWANEILRDLSLRWVSEGYHILQPRFAVVLGPNFFTPALQVYFTGTGAILTVVICVVYRDKVIFHPPPKKKKNTKKTTKKPPQKTRKNKIIVAETRRQKKLDSMNVIVEENDVQIYPYTHLYTQLYHIYAWFYISF